MAPKTGTQPTPEAGSKPSRGWDESSHMDLLHAYIGHTNGGKAVITDITQRMKAMGYTYSYDAIKYYRASTLSFFSPAATYFRPTFPFANASLFLH